MVSSKLTKIDAHVRQRRIAFRENNKSLKHNNIERWDWSVAQLFNLSYPDLRLREAVRTHPLLERTTLGSLIENRFGLETFLTECRGLPGCGDTQIKRLRTVLLEELGTGPQISEAAFPINGMFHTGRVSSIDDVYLPLLRLAQFTSFVYAPSSIPEIAKTRAVLTAEMSDSIDIDDYFEKLRPLRNSLSKRPQTKGLILLDTHILTTILKRQGRYQTLSLADVAQQRLALLNMETDMPVGIKTMVTDFESSGLSCSAMVGEMIILYGMGGYATFRNPTLLSQMRARYEIARSAGCSLTDFLG